jgi:hypothetical protein
MLRRAMIILAAAMAALALATAPAGAGAGNLELYSAPNYGGTHRTVLPTTVDDFLNDCADMTELVSTLPSAQSAHNNTNFDLTFYQGIDCTEDQLDTVLANTSSDFLGDAAQSVFVSS